MYPDAIELPIQPPRARLSKTLSRSDTNMYLSSILSSRGPSRVTTPTYQNIVDLDDVEVEDSDDDVPGRDKKEPGLGMGMGKLGSFKTKLIRRISHRVDTKPDPKPHVGTSEEELARRAELRRLMHKRIREELKSEEEEEDSRLPSPQQISIVNNCKEPGLPGGGPRDTIEFSVSGCDELETGTMADISTIPISATKQPQEPSPGSSGCPKSAMASINSASKECNASLKDVTSAIHPSSPSHPVPVHLLGGGGRDSPSSASRSFLYREGLPDRCIEPLDEAKKASHLQSPGTKGSSSSLDSVTTHQHKLDTFNCSNLTTHDETVDTSQTVQVEHDADVESSPHAHEISTYSVDMDTGRCSTLDMWLRSQELQCTSILSSRPNSEIAFRRPREADAQSKQVMRARQSDISTEISNCQSQTVDSISISQLNTPGGWPKLPEDRSDAGKPPTAIPSNESITLHHILTEMENALGAEAKSGEDQAQVVSSRYTSSRYTTRPSSQQATPIDQHLTCTEQLNGRNVLQPLPAIYGEY